MKNAFQLAVISAMPLVEPLLAGGFALGGTAGADRAFRCDCVGAAENDPVVGDELELPEQAGIAATSTRPSAGAT